jgi:hypothetical protein
LFVFPDKPSSGFFPAQASFGRQHSKIEDEYEFEDEFEDDYEAAEITSQSD